MSYSTPRKLRDGDILTADDWNSMIAYSDPSNIAIAAAPVAAGLTDLLVLATVASVSQTPISRRALLGLWRAKS